MLDLRAYRLGFAPVVAALVVLAFSLQGVPEPLEPEAGTIEFDAETAIDTARDLVRVAPERRPGSEDAGAAADLVRNRFEGIASGSVAEQRFEGSVAGEDVELRNVLLTLPGASDRAILVLAERGSRAGTGAAASAAATGTLLELAAELGVSGRERTLIFGSIDGAGAEAEGARELFAALPDRTEVDAALVISQPGVSAPAPPHVITSSGGEERPSELLLQTAGETLASRAQLPAGLDGPLGQVARLALPAAAGIQAALLEEGVDAVAISGAAEAPVAPAAGDEAASQESLERLGAATLALVGALDAGPGPLGGAPETYVRLGDNTIPGWVLALLALALLAPPSLAVGRALVRAGADGTSRAAMRWAGEWAVVAVVPLLALYLFALAGLIPRPDVPYDPGRFDLGSTEVLAMVVLAGVAGAAWWALGLRRLPARPAPATLGAAAGAVCIAACLVAWTANPFLALVLAPLAHVVMVHATPGRRAASLAVPVAAAAAVPLVAVVVHVGSALDWGAAAPWQLVVLVAGGGVGILWAASLSVALAAVAAVVATALRSRSAMGGDPQARSRGRP